MSHFQKEKANVLTITSNGKIQKGIKLFEKQFTRKTNYETCKNIKRCLRKYLQKVFDYHAPKFQRIYRELGLFVCLDKKYPNINQGVGSGEKYTYVQHDKMKKHSSGHNHNDKYSFSDTQTSSNDNDDQDNDENSYDNDAKVDCFVKEEKKYQKVNDLTQLERLRALVAENEANENTRQSFDRQHAFLYKEAIQKKLLRLSKLWQNKNKRRTEELQQSNENEKEGQENQTQQIQQKQNDDKTNQKTSYSVNDIFKIADSDRYIIVFKNHQTATDQIKLFSEDTCYQKNRAILQFMFDKLDIPVV